MRTLVLLMLLLSFNLKTIAQHSSHLNYRIFNIGNIVDIENKKEYAAALTKLISSSSVPAILILNGDLIKKNKSTNLGADSLKVFDFLAKLSSLKNTKTIVIPGDRDWNNSKKNGLKKVLQLEELVEHDRLKNVKWILDNGCPGPELIELNSNLLLMTINTQWWNHPFNKPTAIDGVCSINTKKDFIIEFENALAETEEKNLIIAGHFPLIEHTRPSLKNYLFPTPLAGSFMASFHQNIGGTTDIINERFNGIRKTMLNRISVKKNVVCLSGHAFNTQIIKENNNFYINNGLPEKAKQTARIKPNEYSSTHPGITELMYFDNGKIATNNYIYVNATFSKDQEIELYHPTTDNKEVSGNNILNNVSGNTFNESNESIKINAGNYRSSFFKNLFIGKHYRDSWNQVIDVPILNMDTTFEGLTAYARGGGHQTTSVKMYGKNGYSYTFRSVNKDATRGLNSELKNSLIAWQLQDNISIQHPYGGLIVSELLDHTSILHARPVLYVLPQTGLGELNRYGGLLGTLEEHQKKSKKIKHAFANADKLLQSHQLNQKLYESYHHKIDAKEYGKARVFDLLIGDYGKHQDNWKWAGYKSDTGTIYSAIPRDRDLVFGRRDGLIPWLTDRKWALESGENFGYKINDVKSLMWVARHPDRFLTNEMDKQDWLDASRYLQTQLTADVIHKAAKSLPLEIYNLSGKTIAEKLKARIKELDKYTLQYYKLLAKQVDITGTNKKEYFEVIRNEEQTVEVSIYSIKENTDTVKGKKLLYKRTFYPNETKEIRLYGLSENDVFNITGTAKKSIPIIIVGGEGADIITDNSFVKGIGKQTKIYENSNNSILKLGHEAKRMNTWNNELYHFQPTAFEYNRYLPLFSMNYSPDNGFGTGVGVLFTKREKFGNLDYSAKHKFILELSTEQNNIFKYHSRFHHIFQKWDFNIGGLIANHHDFANFFGIGNSTLKNNSLARKGFYKTTYNSYSANTGLIREFWKKSSFSANVEFQHNAAQIDKNTIAFSDPDINSPLIFGTIDNNILIGSVAFNIDFRDRKDLPEKGIRIVGNYKNGWITTNNNSSYHIAKGFIEHYFTAYLPSPITLGIKAGGSMSNGKIPFYNLVYLGNGTNLRGYKKNRFTGKSSAYLNSELRIQLANFSSSFIPIRMGLRGFYDTGRIFDTNDSSEKWHNGFGGGFFWVLLKEQFTLNLSIARSDDENHLFLFSLGKSFN